MCYGLFLQLVNKFTAVKCVCHGVSGSCSVRTCFKNVQDTDELGHRLFKLYYIAKHVKKVGTKLKPVDSSAPELTENELAYLEYSPNFCKRNLTCGIYGPSGRRCYPDRTDQSSCSNLCCGGLVEQRKVLKAEDQSKCCKFVWCCYLDCSKCRTYEVTEYYCK